MSETILATLLIFSATVLGLFCGNLLAYIKQKLS